LVRHERLFSSGGETAGERHAKPDLDRRLSRLRDRRRRAQYAREQKESCSEE
jgi:hypothetical protein